MRKIFYNGDKAYLVIRSIGEGCLDPEFYGITDSKFGLTPEQVAMQILKLWKEEYRCDHVLRQGKRYLLCQTIKDVDIIE